MSFIYKLFKKYTDNDTDCARVWLVVMYKVIAWHMESNRNTYKEEYPGVVGLDTYKEEYPGFVGLSSKHTRTLFYTYCLRPRLNTRTSIITTQHSTPSMILLQFQLQFSTHVSNVSATHCSFGVWRVIHMSENNPKKVKIFPPFKLHTQKRTFSAVCFG